MNILILQNKILHYRLPLYNELSKYYNVSVLHSGDTCGNENIKFKEILVKNYMLGPFNFQKGVVKKALSKEFDFVIIMFDFHYPLNILIMILKAKNTNYILWGQWLTGNLITDKLRVYFSNKKQKSILYTESAKKEFIDRGVLKANLFVANNTIDVGERYKCFKELDKNTILFIGSLNKRKQLDVLLNAFFEIIDDIPKSINLVIIGDGEEKEKLIKLIENLNLKNRVFMKGKITNNKNLIGFYKKALVNVSYGQAGLSVLQSFGYGVPFITKINAVSGGEKTNIINGYNGYLCDDTLEALKEKLLILILNKKLARQMGENAYVYYSKKSTINNMVEGFVNTIESV